MSTTPNPQQVKFNQQYITSADIRDILMVSRTAIHHRRKAGKLPNPIELNGGTITLWERADVLPHLQQWSNDMYGRVVEGI